MATLDPVAQARAWLTGQTGRPLTTPPNAVEDHDDVVCSVGPPAPEAAEGADADADAEKVARDIALRKLTAQARTRHELDQALRKSNVPDEITDTVLDRLEHAGLVDDQAFARDWVQSRQRRRHLSRSALRRELQGKGVDRHHVEAALTAVDSDDELAAARDLAAKKSAATRGLDPAVRQRRLAGMLARRGFGSGVVATVLGELRDESTGDPSA